MIDLVSGAPADAAEPHSATPAGAVDPRSAAPAGAAGPHRAPPADVAQPVGAAAALFPGDNTQAEMLEWATQELAIRRAEAQRDWEALRTAEKQHETDFAALHMAAVGAKVSAEIRSRMEAEAAGWRRQMAEEAARQEAPQRQDGAAGPGPCQHGGGAGPG